MTTSTAEFTSDDGFTLRGVVTLPDASPSAAVVMTHGAGGHKEWFLPSLAERLAAAGIASLAYDHRNFGESDGPVRGEIDPQLQIRDYRAAITWVTQQSWADPERIGIFGTSLSGGEVLVVGAIDRRVRCVVSQVPLVSGNQSTIRRYNPGEIRGLRERWDADRRARSAGEAPTMIEHSSSDANDPLKGRSAERVQYYAQLDDTERKHWTNLVTLRSGELVSEFEPGPYIPLISPTPLLMISSQEEVQTIARAYETALEPKELVITKFGHYAPYMSEKDVAQSAITRWFSQWL